jgi:hypothetical protein
MINGTSIYINQATDFSVELTIESELDLDIETLSVISQIRKNFASSVAGEFDIEYIGDNVFRISMSANTTASLSPGKYVYDVLAYNDDETYKVSSGLVYVIETVTRRP